MPKIFFIDPQSYNNLSLYDKGVMCEFPKDNVIFFGSDLWNCDKMPNVEMHLWFHYNSFKNPIAKLLSYTRSLLKIAKYVNKNLPDLVHIQWTRVMPIDILFTKYLQSKKIKVIHTAHNVLPHNTGMKYKGQFEKYYNLVDHIIVHSELTKKEMISLFKLPSDKISVIPHGMIMIEADYKKVKDRILELKKLYNIEDKLVFSSLGAQSYYKGVDNIVEVWSNNSEFRDNPKCHLMIIGKNEGIDISPLKEVSNVTIIDERLDNVDFLSYIRLSDVILLPYRAISQSGVLFSALSNNIPVLVSDVGGLSEPLKIADVGWNIGEPTKENLKKQMLGLVQYRENVLEMKARKEEFQSVQKHYDWHRISKMTKKLYEKLI